MEGYRGAAAPHEVAEREAAPSAFNVDAAIDTTYGSGLYACVSAVILGGFYTLVNCYQAFNTFLKPKIVQDERLQGFSPGVVSHCQSFLFVGFACGCLIASPVADSRGRYSTIFLLSAGLVLGLVFAALAPFSGSPLLYSAAELFEGAFFALLPCAYVYFFETIPADKKNVFTVLLNIAQGAGLVFMCWVFGNVTIRWSWEKEVLLWASPIVVFMAAESFLLHESPKFLATKGQWKKAREVIHRIARFNGVNQLTKAEEGEFQKIELQGGTTPAPAMKRESPFAVLWQPMNRSRLLLCTVCWIALALGFNGLTYSAGNFSPNLHLNMALLASADMVGSAIPMVIAPRLGLVRTQGHAIALSAVALGLCAVIPQGSQLLVGLCVLGRLLNITGFVTSFLLTSECFPTECRATALGICNFFARLSCLLAPILSDFSAKTALLVFAICGAVASAATSYLPDVDGTTRTMKAAS